MLRERSYCLDLDESARSCWCDSKDGDGGAVIAPYRTGRGVRRPGVDSGIEIDRQFGDMLGAGPGRSEHGEHIAHGLFRLRFESFEQIAITVRAVLPADVQRRPSGNRSCPARRRGCEAAVG